MREHKLSCAETVRYLILITKTWRYGNGIT